MRNGPVHWHLGLHRHRRQPGCYGDSEHLGHHGPDRNTDKHPDSYCDGRQHAGTHVPAGEIVSVAPVPVVVGSEQQWQM